MVGTVHQLATTRTPSGLMQSSWIPFSCSVISVGSIKDKGNIKIHGLAPINTDSIHDNKLMLLDECEYSSKFRCCTFFDRYNQTNRDYMACGGLMNGKLTIWDVNRISSAIPLSINENAHSSTINAIDSFKSNNNSSSALEYIIGTGGKDGSVSLWDSRNITNHIQRFINNDQSIPSKQQCWSLQLYGGNKIIGGFENGDLVCYDIRNNKELLKINLSFGISSLNVNSQLNTIMVGGNQSTLKILSLNEQSLFNEIQSVKDIPQTVWSCKYSPFNSNHIALAGGDGSVSIYENKNGTAKFIDKFQHNDTLPMLSVEYSKDYQGLIASVSLNRSLSVLVVPSLS